MERHHLATTIEEVPGFKYMVTVRWSDVDCNGHVRHSAYYDWATTCRLTFLAENGLSLDELSVLSIGPVLFREECIFHKEVRLGDEVHICFQLQAARPDFSRWRFIHHIQKNKKDTAAIVTVEGAWLDTRQRKLTLPPKKLIEILQLIPKSSDFVWT